MKTQKTVNRAFMSVLAIAAMLVTPLAAFASQTDNRIESSFKETYVYKTFLKDDSIKVKSTDGAVVLTGTVHQDSNRALAEETVASLPGVKTVNNQLTLSADSPNEYSDGWLTLKVKTALMLHKNVSAFSTQVSTENGTVILRGEAPSTAHRDLTTEYARDVKGVRNVRNEMTIAKSPAPASTTRAQKIDDASITAQVKTSLITHQSTSAAKTEVHTVNGVVTLKGVANNAAEKALVTKLVNDINGVNEVVNNMTIKVAAK